MGTCLIRAGTIIVAAYDELPRHYGDGVAEYQRGWGVWRYYVHHNYDYGMDCGAALLSDCAAESRTATGCWHPGSISNHVP